MKHQKQTKKPKHKQKTSKINIAPIFYRCSSPAKRVAIWSWCFQTPFILKRTNSLTLAYRLETYLTMMKSLEFMTARGCPQGDPSWASYFRWTLSLPLGVVLVAELLVRACRKTHHHAISKQRWARTCPGTRNLTHWHVLQKEVLNILISGQSTGGRLARLAYLVLNL